MVIEVALCAGGEEDCMMEVIQAAGGVACYIY